MQGLYVNSIIDLMQTSKNEDVVTAILASIFRNNRNILSQFIFRALQISNLPQDIRVDTGFRLLEPGKELTPEIRAIPDIVIYATKESFQNSVDSQPPLIVLEVKIQTDPSIPQLIDYEVYPKWYGESRVKLLLISDSIIELPPFHKVLPWSFVLAALEECIRNNSDAEERGCLEEMVAAITTRIKWAPKGISGDTEQLIGTVLENLKEKGIEVRRKDTRGYVGLKRRSGGIQFAYIIPKPRYKFWEILVKGAEIPDIKCFQYGTNSQQIAIGDSKYCFQFPFAYSKEMLSTLTDILLKGHNLMGKSRKK